LEEAKKRGFSKVATGHYAQIKEDKEGIFHLISGKDNNKDQSYFLYYFNQQQLKKIIFPVGNLLKDETRKIAKKNELPVSDKKESQEICFIPDDDYRNFLKKYLKLKAGNIVDTKGKILGKHSGLINYTIGQRKGLGNLSIKDESRKPLFVLGFNKKNNSLIVGLEKDLYQKKAFLKDFHWISEEAKRVAFSGKGLKAKIRYRSEAIPCVVKKSKNELEISFRKPQRAITPGQSAVFYFKREVLGGGIIQ
jgi:tRNA-specific 2-thiouridylase